MLTWFKYHFWSVVSGTNWSFLVKTEREQIMNELETIPLVIQEKNCDIKLFIQSWYNQCIYGKEVNVTYYISFHFLCFN